MSTQKRCKQQSGCVPCRRKEHRDVWQCGSRPISVSGRSIMATCLRREQRLVVYLVISRRDVLQRGSLFYAWFISVADIK